MAYVVTFWTFYVLHKEYKIIASMRLHFLASETRRPDQFTVSDCFDNGAKIFKFNFLP